MSEFELPAPPPSAARAGGRVVAPLVVCVLLLLAGVGLGGYGVYSFFGYRTVAAPASLGKTVSPGSLLVYRVDSTSEIHRGDLIVFEGDALSPEIRGRAIKRVIAVGGDTVRCCSPQGDIVVDGKPVHEPYLQLDAHVDAGPFTFQATVPAGTVFVAGDVRNNSDDSRFHDQNGHSGAIPQSRVDGVVVGTGSLFSFEPLAPVAAFAAAGLPGTSPEDRTIDGIPWLVLGGAGLVAAGLVGMIVVLVRSRGRRRRAAAGPPAALDTSRS